MTIECTTFNAEVTDDVCVLCPVRFQQCVEIEECKFREVKDE